MNTATYPDRTQPYGLDDRPARRVNWTRLSDAMGYTNTEAGRAEIRAAVEQMTWSDPSELTGVLDAAPVARVIAFLLGGRSWAVEQVGVGTLGATDPLRPIRRLLAIESVTGERYVLMDDCACEWVHIYTDRAVGELAGALP